MQSLLALIIALCVGLLIGRFTASPERVVEIQEIEVEKVVQKEPPVEIMNAVKDTQASFMACVQELTETRLREEKATKAKTDLEDLLKTANEDADYWRQRYMDN